MYVYMRVYGIPPKCRHAALLVIVRFRPPGSAAPPPSDTGLLRPSDCMYVFYDVCMYSGYVHTYIHTLHTYYLNQFVFELSNQVVVTAVAGIGRVAGAQRQSMGDTGRGQRRADHLYIHIHTYIHISKR